MRFVFFSGDSLNASWEQAVSRARGLPDGATEDSDSDGSFFHQSDPENSPEKEAKGGKKKAKEEKKKAKNVR